MVPHRVVGFALCILSLTTVTNSLADTWPQFRGMTGSGVSRETNLPVRWSETDGVLWTTQLTGRGNSGPAVTRNRIDITTQMEDDNSLWVVSINRKTGRIIRKIKVGHGVLKAKGPKNLYGHRHNAATPTPAADADHVWAFFGSGLLVCVDAKNGKVKWRHDMVKEYGSYDITFGMGSSPRLWGELLYVSCLTKGPSYVVAFDKKTGKEVWKTDRDLPAKDDGPDAYSTPFVYQAKGTSQLLISGSDHLAGYDLRNGKQLWYSGGLTIKSLYGRIIASPAADGGVIVATSANPGGGGKGHVLAIRGGGSGNVTATHRLWKHTQSTPDSSTPVCLNGRVYLSSDNGVASCLKLKTGDMLWRKRLPQGTYHASLVAGDGKVYFLNINGVCTVIAAAGEGEVIATNRLPGTFYATPAISDGVIFLRSYERLYAIGGK